MHLPGRLSSSTLGDLLGGLHRESITGIIELCEIGGPGRRGVPGRVHRLHLRGGVVVAIDTALSARPFDEVLATSGLDATEAVRAELRERMEALFSIEDARVAFHTARPVPTAMRVRPLGPSDFLHGRPRSRDRGRARASEPPRSQQRPVTEDPSERARRLLGIPKDAGVGEVRRAFRRLAGAMHPDRLGPAAAEERERHAARFVELAAAYHLLVA